MLAEQRISTFLNCTENYELVPVLWLVVEVVVSVLLVVSLGLQAVKPTPRKTVAKMMVKIRFDMLNSLKWFVV